MQPGVWYHIVGTYSQGGSIKTYVNAKLDREQETTNILAASEGPLKIGCEPFNDVCLFNGLMDDLQIYNYPLSEAEVAALYAGQALPTMTAKAEILAASGDKPEASNYWILVLAVVVIAAVAIGLTIRKEKKTT